MKWMLLLALALVGCTQTPRTAPRGIRTVGHGGMGPDHAFPMNTKEAVMACLSSQRNGVEVDVQMTKDGGFICYHDQDLADKTTCTGLVNSYELDHFGTNCLYNSDSGEHGILFLQDVLNSADEEHTVVLDCKLFAEGDWATYLDDYAAALAALMMNESTAGIINVECQVTDFLDKVMAENSGALTFYYAKDFASGLATASAKGYDGITIGNGLITAEQVEEAQRKGLQVALFGIDASDEPSARAKGADLLQVDQP